ncbi:hypothetical protein [Ottowia sp. VDI28]|uniref:hypothetical protein n=1 Tax=Ottowia sp. VDI28 TaxID=3133968 RepID=UPI003C30342E
MEDSTPSTGHAQYRQMTSEQRAAWGRVEFETRQRDVLDRSVDPDAAAETRRLSIGASRRVVNSMVRQAALASQRNEARRQRDGRTQPPAFTKAQIADLARVARASETEPKGRQYERDLTAQQQGLANVGLLEGWK